jgi:hypothetical protein
MAMKCTLKRILVSGFLMIPLVLFLQNPSGFPYPTQVSKYSDFSISHYPNTVYLKRSLLEFGVVPLWSPSILSGSPFAANPLSGLWYPAGWIALLFPLPLGLNIVAALHLLLGGLGLYVLLKSEGLSTRASIFGALAFEFSPKLFAHYGAGHLSLFYAVSWTPWLLLAIRKARINGGKWGMAPPGIMALICFADPRWAAYAGLIWVIYSVANSHVWEMMSGFPNKNTIGERITGFSKLLVSHLKQLIPQIMAAGFLAAPILIPLLEYSNLSTRSQMSVEDILLHSLPPSRVLGLLFPDFGGSHELMIYSGIVVLILIVISIIKKRKGFQEKFWLWVSFFTLVYAFGSYLPLAEFLIRIPGFNLLRVPSRSLFIISMVFAILSAYSVDAIRKGDLGDSRRKIKLILVALVGFAFILTSGIIYITREFQQNFVVGIVLVTVSSLWVIFGVERRLSGYGWYAGLVLIAIIDWIAVDTSVLSFQDKKNVLQEQRDVAAFLTQEQGFYRVYSPSYSLPQQVSIDYHIELADGVDPLQIDSYADYMEAATGVPREGYQVTIPTFNTGDTSRDNQDFLPDPILLGLLNVRYVISEFDLLVPGLELLKQIGETRVYENLEYFPRAWIQPRELEFGSAIKKVEISSWSPNQIEITANGPGLLVLSEIMYPGWTVKVDGEMAQIQTASEILRAVDLEPGFHDVIFTFQPRSVLFGLGLFTIGITLTYFLSRPKNRS